MSANRRLLGFTFVLGSLGTGLELLLMEHTDGIWQKLPLALLALGGVAFGAVAFTRTTMMQRTFQSVMLLFAATGIAGSVLHYQGNVEFEREMDPETSGITLVRDAMQGATPALAPGTMMLLGAVGWGYSRLTEREYKRSDV